MSDYETFRKKMLAHRDACAEELARGMYERVCGSWDAAGYETQVAFRDAGYEAYDTLSRKHGFDLFALRDGGWGLVT